MKITLFENVRYNIIILEDDSACLSFLSDVLKSNNLNIVGISKELIDFEILFDSYKVDLIISVLRVKNNNVFEFMAQDKFLNTPILFVANIIDTDKFTLENKHLKTYFLTNPVNEYIFILTVKLLLIAYPPRKTDFIEIIGGNQKVIRLMYRDIVYIEAKGNYTFIHTLFNKVYIKKKPLKKIKLELDVKFVQVNKSQVINSIFIERVDIPLGLVQIENKKIKIGRVFKSKFKNFLKNNK